MIESANGGGLVLRRLSFLAACALFAIGKAVDIPPRERYVCPHHDRESRVSGIFMTYFGDIFRVGNERWRSLLASALLIALCGGGLPWYAARYDSPAGIESKPKTAPLKLLGHDGTLTVTCQCPPYLIARKARYLTFHYALQ